MAGWFEGATPQRSSRYAHAHAHAHAGVGPTCLRRVAFQHGHQETWGVPRVASPAATFVGHRIDERRRERGLTHDQLAAATGIDSSNLRAYMSGRAMPNVHSLVRIATVLEVALGELLDGLTPDLFDATTATTVGTRRSSTG